MVRQITILFIGGLCGSLAMYFFLSATPAARFSHVPERDIESVPEVSLVEAERHRANRYESIRTIEDTLALPTDFAETEALYAIAGRADADELQNLIHQAARVQERNDRKAALRILFLRLTELDPYSALAIARTPAFQGDESLERSVWVAWGRLDFDAALKAAAGDTPAKKNLAAQSLYAAIREPDEEKTEAIRATLGVAPGKKIQAQRLYALADESPAAAIQYIESLSSRSEQYEHFAWLAQHLASTGQIADGRLEELIKSPVHRQIFQQSLMMYGAQRNPEDALKQYLAGPANRNDRGQAYVALQQLAQQDPEKALEYLDKFPGGQARQTFIGVVAGSLAKSDPARALEWARENDKSASRTALMSVITEIAQHDPERAFAEAQRIDNAQSRRQSISNILMIAASMDAPRAAQMLESISDPELRRNALSQLSGTWAQTDFDGAVAWVASLPAEEQRLAATSMGQRLVDYDVDRAIELLTVFPRLDSQMLRMSIAQNLVQNRSLAAAQAFIAPYKGTEDYAKLQVAVVRNAARMDPARAMQLAEAVEDKQSRDHLYASIVGQQANRDPRQALQWLSSIEDPAAHRMAVSSITTAWYLLDAASADAWLKSLPSGATRDDAIAAASANFRGSPGEAQALIKSIGDADKRKQAMLMHVQYLVRTNPDEAERLLSELELTDGEREQYRQIIEIRSTNEYLYSY